MGTLGYSSCKYDRDYPCSYGCSNKDCEYYEEEEQENDNSNMDNSNM